ncbi:MAG TPA: hypothetical protein VHS99_27090 [Chloroflexota bacterium]|jgi:hypothetical protein|nr:hypothetical protein [Chloroflexota bacterium]
MATTPPLPATDGTALAGSRLAGLVDERVPPAVRLDAERQLAGMLTGLAELGRAVPVLAEPLLDPDAAAGAVTQGSEQDGETSEGG